MTAKEWRKKHPKCQYCSHLINVTLPPFCIGFDTWCNAKEKIVNSDLPRPFCRLFEVKSANKKSIGNERKIADLVGSPKMAKQKDRRANAGQIERV